MRVSGLIAVLALVAAPFGVAPSVHAADRADREVTRIRAHFDSVLTELTSRDVSSLSASQRSNRARLTLALANYRERGVFPHNYDFPGQSVPYFVDRKTGTLCAVAHLLASTGRRDIVDRVARQNNNVWVVELAGDTALATWLDANGITLDEAARIQVPYNSVSDTEIAAMVTVAVVAPISLATSLVTTMWNGSTNSDGHRRGVSWTGAVSSTLTMASGGLFFALADDRKPGLRMIGGGVMALGGLGLYTASRSIRTHNDIVRTEREEEARRRVAQATVSPMITGSLSNPGVGATLSLRF
jgi:hypothetical protein